LYFKVLLTMENKSTSAEDIRTIRKMMEESTRFLSLSGLSGIFAGLIAIAGAVTAYLIILKNGSVQGSVFFIKLQEKGIAAVKWQLLADAAAVLLLSVISAVWFSYTKMKKGNKRFWSPVSKRLLINLLIPLITGGIFTLVLLIQNQPQLIVPSWLIFYGLSLVNAGKFTYGEVFFLGLFEILIGLVSSFFPGWDLLFWVVGFGFLHIIYGLAMYRRYEA
jgi:hypothetical protein